MNDNCDICVNNAKQPANLLTSNYWLVILSKDQGYLGRVYVTLRNHKASLSDLSSEEWNEYENIVRRLEKACTLAFGATLFNWSCLMNNAYQKKPSLPHVHWHFRPRYEKSVIINNTHFNDPEFGHHYDREQRREVSQQDFDAILAKYKAHL